MVVTNGAAYSAAQQSDKTVSAERSKNLTGIESRQQLKKACQQFESIFLYYLLQKMRDTVPKEGFFEQGVSYDIIQSMHDEALAEELSKGGGLGLADQIYKQLSKYI